jgi:hypothetical protein
MKRQQQREKQKRVEGENIGNVIKMVIHSFIAAGRIKSIE